MTVIGRVLARYWFIAPILLIVASLQLGLGFLAADNATNDKNSEFEAQDRLNFSSINWSRLPTLTSTPIITETPKPSPTATQVLNETLPGQRHSTGDTIFLAASTPIPTPPATPTILPTPTGQGYTAIAPILMYHYLSAPPPDADAIRLDLSVSPELFESHLAYLQEAGYETISFSQLAFALSQEADLPAKPIIISFDDGYRDNYDNAFPLLRKYGYTATFFIFTQPVQTANVDYLTWDMIVEMHQAGMEFGSHSFTHPDLRGRDTDFLINEILTSKQAIEAHIGGPVRIFSYPAGRYDELTIRVVKSASFWGAVTTKWGANQSFEKRFEMPRVRVRGNDTAKSLAQKLDSFK